MGGRASRRKGLRAEYGLRDLLRQSGFTADRVPCSGAAQGFPGDVEAWKDGRRYLFECKNHAGVFTRVYRLFDQAAVDGLLCLALGTPTDHTLLRIADTADKALESVGHYPYTGDGQLVGKQFRGKLLNMRKLIKECDCLVIKDNHKPYLFLRYL